MKEQNIQKNTVYSVIKSAAAIVFPLISFPFASRTLLAESVGKVNFGNSIISYFGLLASLGIATYAIRECAKVKEDKHALSKTASQLFSINMLTTLVSYVLLAVTLLVARPLENYRMLIVVQSSTILLTTLGADWLNSAMEDFRFITLRTVLFQLLSLVLMFLFVHEPDDYLIYALISVISAGGANITNMIYRRRFCRVRLTLDVELKRHMKPILLMFSLILSQTVYVNSDVVIIGLFRGDYEVGLYSTAVKIYTIVNTMVASVAFVVMPKMAYHYSNGNSAQIRELLRYSLGFIVTLGLPCLVGINMLCPEIIALLAGEAYLPAVPALHILTVSLAASFASGFVGNLILIPSGREKVCLITSLISASANLILNLLLIPQFGFVAAAFTTAVAELIGFVVGLCFVAKELDLGKLDKLVLPPVVGCAVMAAALLALRNISMLALRVAAGVGIGAGIYLAVLLVMKHDFTVNMLKKLKK